MILTIDEWLTEVASDDYYGGMDELELAAQWGLEGKGQ